MAVPPVNRNVSEPGAERGQDSTLDADAQAKVPESREKGAAVPVLYQKRRLSQLNLRRKRDAQRKIDCGARKHPLRLRAERVLVRSQRDPAGQ